MLMPLQPIVVVVVLLPVCLLPWLALVSRRSPRLVDWLLPGLVDTAVVRRIEINRLCLLGRGGSGGSGTTPALFGLNLLLLSGLPSRGLLFALLPHNAGFKRSQSLLLTVRSRSAQLTSSKLLL